MRRPYIIVTPTWCVSAGVKVLHLLCHHLNTLGIEAYLLFTRNITGSAELVNPLLNTPVVNGLLENASGDWERLKNEAIFIYPDSIVGNPFGVKRIVRYILGKEGPVTPDAANEYRLLFSAGYALDKTADNKSLFFTTIDMGIFHSRTQIPRTQDMLWLGKGAKFCQEKPKNCVDITYSWPESPQALAEELRKTRYLYSYDPVSSITTEAVLCGAVVIFKHLSYHDQVWERANFEGLELGAGGLAFSDTAFEIERALHTQVETMERVRYYNATFPMRLLEFVENSQSYFRGS